MASERGHGPVAEWLALDENVRLGGKPPPVSAVHLRNFYGGGFVRSDVEDRESLVAAGGRELFFVRCQDLEAPPAIFDTGVALTSSPIPELSMVIRRQRDERIRCVSSSRRSRTVLRSRAAAFARLILPAVRDG